LFTLYSSFDTKLSWEETRQVESFTLW